MWLSKSNAASWFLLAMILAVAAMILTLLKREEEQFTDMSEYPGVEGVSDLQSAGEDPDAQELSPLDDAAGLASGGDGGMTSTDDGPHSDAGDGDARGTFELDGFSGEEFTPY